MDYLVRQLWDAIAVAVRKLAIEHDRAVMGSLAVCILKR